MTTARRKRKQFCAAFAACAGLLAYAGLIFLLTAGPPSVRAAATERIVVDWHTGLAIAGYDPVAFFTDGKPMIGSAEFELRYGGAVWRFANIGNRAAFAASPTSICRNMAATIRSASRSGVAVAGNPNVWLIAGEKLFLFYDAERRDRFAADPERLVNLADRKWPERAQ